MSTDPFSTDDERAGYEWLARDVTPAGGAEGFRQLKQQQRGQEAADGFKARLWRNWVTRTGVVIAGALLGLIVDAGLTDHWDHLDQRVLVLLIVGVLPPVAIYSKMIQHHAQEVLLTSIISRQAELALLRHDPAIKAARWAFFIALPAATFGAGAQSTDMVIGYATAIGCELSLLAVDWALQRVFGEREETRDS